MKEIFEQPQTIKDSFRGRLDVSSHTITLSGLDSVLTKLDEAQRIVIVGCGTSWHAGLLAEYIIEELCRINVEVEYASEFRYRNPIITDKDFIIAISQSGETADTLVALEKAKGKGATIFGVVNVVGSSIARLADAGMYTHAGPEIGVASTKAFTAQVVALILFALKVARYRGTITNERYERLVDQLGEVPNMVEWIFATQLDKIKHIAYKYAHAKDFLYLGRGYNFPIALEGALKLKEISYIHAEGYPAAEMKHGPIALVEDTLPIVFVATKDSYHEKIISNMQEVKAREGMLIAIISEGDEVTTEIADDCIVVPFADEIISPLLSTIPLQLLSYYIGVSKGLNVDMPRNLAKSVTVE